MNLNKVKKTKQLIIEQETVWFIVSEKRKIVCFLVYVNTFCLQLKKKILCGLTNAFNTPATQTHFQL